MTIKELCRKHGFSEASYYLWRGKFGGMDVPDSKRLKSLEAENARLKKLLAESLLKQEVTREGLRKKWQPHRLVASWCGGCRHQGSRSDAACRSCA